MSLWTYLSSGEGGGVSMVRGALTTERGGGLHTQWVAVLGPFGRGPRSRGLNDA